MDHHGILSLLPPFLAIILCFVTKEVFTSLIIGIVVGALMLFNFNIIGTYTGCVQFLIDNVTDPGNAGVLLFVISLGGITGLLSASGGIKAFGDWSIKKIKSRSMALLATWLLGLIIYIDDYFNCVTVGTVMRPITDRFRISRAKLAFMIDATAAPVCAIAPLSTWAGYVMSLMAADLANFTTLKVSPFQAFVGTIPYNFYPWLIIILMLITAFTDLEFGPMAQAEKRAIKYGQLLENTTTPPPGDDFENQKTSDKGKAYDLILPLLMLIVLTMVAMAYTGGYFDGGIGLNAAIMDSDSVISLVYGSFLTIIITVAVFKIRGVLELQESVDAVIQGFKSMMLAVSVLSLAWTIGTVTKELGAGIYIAEIVSRGFPTFLIPLAIFLASGILAFSLGTSWGTFAIMVPISMPIIMMTDETLLFAAIAGILSGASFGDHCSPISDTTIMSSTGAGCHYYEHNKTQLPYAFTAAAVSLLGFFLSGIIRNGLICFVITLVVFFVVVKLLHTFWNEDIPEVTSTVQKESPVGGK
ncbi:MAG TPA: Na+/H+ antiporter NhaC family protein [Thermoanaerobacterales bacterium]|nr:Na+/H+ antiporter NhaC family protein [Thermoanaerobacterales bacterium]